MTLFKKIQDILLLGYEVKFSSFASNLIISIKQRDAKYTPKESWLPLSDHFKETKIVDCIEYLINQITNENEKK